MSLYAERRTTRLGKLLIVLALPFLFIRVDIPSSAHELSTGDLSFEDRVFFQAALEKVYWRHKVTKLVAEGQGKEFEAEIPLEAIVQKVEDYARKSQLLEAYWNKPVTGEALQAEIERLCDQTDPELMQELFSTLNNDPRLVAECLARPSFVERRARALYGKDSRFHAQTREEAERSLAEYRERGAQLSGEYREVEWVRGSPEMDAERWNTEVGRLARIFGVDLTKPRLANFPVRQMSPLQEGNFSFYAIEVLQQHKGYLKLGIARWKKEAFDTWWARIRNQWSNAITEPVQQYYLPDLEAQTRAQRLLQIAPQQSARILNPSFEEGSGNSAPPWVIEGCFISQAFPNTGSRHVFMGSEQLTGTTRQAISQVITIPSTSSQASLNFFLSITSRQTATTSRDTLIVELRDFSGRLLTTLAGFSNLDRSSSPLPYRLRGPIDLSRFSGRTLILRFSASFDPSFSTVFRVDDVTMGASLAIDSVNYRKPELFITGTGFSKAAPVVFINGVDVSRYISNTTDTMIILKGSKKKLKLISGSNRVQVLVAGARSNIFTFNL